MCEDTMKLFQRLLVAPAALGLMAPVAVNADTFSSTTTLSGEAVFAVGSYDADAANATNEELHMQYAYTLNLDSSFSGSDNLHVGIEAGNTAATDPFSVLDSAVIRAAGEEADLRVSSLYYSFPVGDIAITAGPILEADDLIGVTTSSYSEGLVASSLPFSSHDFVGAGVGASYAPDNGFSASASILSIDAADSSRGISTDSSDDIATLAVGFNSDSGFGGGIVYTSADGENTITATGPAEQTTFGGGVYYTPEDMPLGVSVSFDSREVEATSVETTSFLVGVDYEVGPGTAHVAYQTTDVDGSDVLDQDTFEVGYSYNVNDNVTVTPAFFSQGTTTNDENDTGMVVETTFSF